MPVDNKVSSLLPFLSSPRLLPDESEAEFQSGLQSLLSELDNPSPLAVALISQLNECLWWIKRHTVDKELLLHEAMGRLLSYRQPLMWAPQSQPAGEMTVRWLPLPTVIQPK